MQYYKVAKQYTQTWYVVSNPPKWNKKGFSTLKLENQYLLFYIGDHKHWMAVSFRGLTTVEDSIRSVETAANVAARPWNKLFWIFVRFAIVAIIFHGKSGRCKHICGEIRPRHVLMGGYTVYSSECILRCGSTRSIMSSVYLSKNSHYPGVRTAQGVAGWRPMRWLRCWRITKPFQPANFQVQARPSWANLCTRMHTYAHLCQRKNLHTKSSRGRCSLCSEAVRKRIGRCRYCMYGWCPVPAQPSEIPGK